MITSSGFNVSHMGFRMGTPVTGALNRQNVSLSFVSNDGAKSDGFGLKGYDVKAVGLYLDGGSKGGVMVEAMWYGVVGYWSIPTDGSGASIGGQI